MAAMLAAKDRSVDQARNTAGALANLASENAEIQKLLTDAQIVPVLVELIKHDNDLVRAMSLRALANLVEYDPAAKQAADLEILPAVCAAAAGDQVTVDPAVATLCHRPPVGATYATR